MKIAQVAPIWYKIPPEKYGGTERIVSQLTGGLVKKGHDVTLFATGDSQTQAKLVSVVPQGILSQGYSFESYSLPLYHMLTALEKRQEFDIIHFHFTNKFDYIAMAIVRELPQIVFTLHVPLPERPELKERRRLLEEKFNHIPLVSISNNQRQDFKLNFLSTIYNAIEIDDCQFVPQVSPDSGMVWIGRMSYQKGLLEAMGTATAVKRKLTIAGKLDTNAPKDVIYFHDKIKEHFNSPYITMIGEIETKEKSLFYGSAKLFLFPLQWEEPFGLVVPEAMACGTPVIAFARGAMPEIIQDGVTGFLVHASDTDKRGDWIIKKTGIEGLCEAVERLYGLSENQYQIMRAACRAYVQEHFTIERMVEGYEKIYESLLHSI